MKESLIISLIGSISMFVMIEVVPFGLFTITVNLRMKGRANQEVLRTYTETLLLGHTLLRLYPYGDEAKVSWKFFHLKFDSRRKLTPLPFVEQNTLILKLKKSLAELK